MAYELKSNDIDIARDLATAYGLKGEYQKSLDVCLEGLKLAPNDVSLGMTVATCYHFLGDDVKAADYSRRAQQIKTPNN